MKKAEEHLQGEAHAHSRQSICSVLKMWYFWKHAVVGQCFYMTLSVMKLSKRPGFTKHMNAWLCISTARTTDNYMHLTFFPRYLHACCIWIQNFALEALPDPGHSRFCLVGQWMCPIEHDSHVFLVTARAAWDMAVFPDLLWFSGIQAFSYWTSVTWGGSMCFLNEYE